MHQIVTKTSNRLYRKRQRRKATKKEKEIIKKLRVSINKDTTNYNLRNAREQWLYKLRYKKIKLAKCEEKWGRRKIISCSSWTRRDSLERWKRRKHTEKRCQK